MIPLDTIKRNVSTNNITFLIDFDKTINIDKSGKAYYYRTFNIEILGITNFIKNLKDDAVYLVNPLISINCSLDSPYLTLSRQFLVSNKSKPTLITDFLNNKLNHAEEEFLFETENYWLIFKYKSVQLDKRIIGK